MSTELNVEKEIDNFIWYLHNVKKMSGNTEMSYRRDLKKMAQYFEEQDMEDPCKITETNLNSYMLYLEKSNMSPATVSRNVASIRAFFQFLCKEHIVDHDPAEALKPPKVEKKLPQILTVQEVDLLLQQPSISTPKGIRDRAMLELLYATGIRVSELIHLKVSDVNMNIDYITCRESERERIVPFGAAAKKALPEGCQGCLRKRRRKSIVIYQLFR